MARSKKVLILGVDGLDPRLTRKYVDMGLMPNTKRYIEAGAQRHDLVMLGGAPTVTPPMWTTLATGCYSNVHGITGFSRHVPENPGELGYNIDSRLCEAEQLWNVTAEAGLKTLVWHWPGSAWPPSSDSENLLVVDGTSPGSVGMSVNQCEKDFLVVADVNTTEMTFIKEESTGATKACIIEDMELEDEEEGKKAEAQPVKRSPIHVISRFEETAGYATELYIDQQTSPIKEATGWASAPEGAKEFMVLPSASLLRRPALILKNEEGIYDTVALYKNKKSEEPIAVCKLGEVVEGVVDEIIKDGEKKPRCNRNYLLVECAEDGSSLKFYVSPAMDMDNDVVWHPKRVFKDVTENVGFAPPTTVIGAQSDLLTNKIMLPMWTVIANWQADSILHLIESEDLDVVFSHFHAVDMEDHQFIRRMALLPTAKVTPDEAEKWMRDLYVQTDNYLGRFIHLLDEGWTIFIISDHAQVASKYGIELLFDMTGLCTPVMEELGYTVTKKDADGKTVIDWEKTTAYVEREGHLYLNLKGRDRHVVDGKVIEGTVDPADKYEMEEKIMTDLYGYRSKITGHRIVSVALRNRDAVLLGQGGPQAGDICLWMAEGYNADHADCLSTTYGEYDTSVSPIFIGTGEGLKKGFETERIIRQVDFVPTVAVLLGLRQPAQCEGAPAYQILEDPIIG